MASTTNIKYQHEIEALLADNSIQAISAADVRTIVTSNYQPQMVWSGYFTQGLTSGYQGYRTLYLNPNYFSNENIMTQGGGGVWEVENIGSGITPGTYNNVTLTPETDFYGYNFASNGGNAQGATFNVVVGANGALSSVTPVTYGTGWFGRTNITADDGKGQLGSFNFTGAAVQPTLRYNGPFDITEAGDDNVYCDISTNSSNDPNADFTKINTIVLATQILTPGNEDSNTGAKIRTTNELYCRTDYRDLTVTLWRIAQ